MNQQTQNQPDFNFIINQPTSAPPKKSKKLLIFGGMAVLLIIVLGVAVLTRSVFKGVSNQLSSQQQSASQVAANYFNLVAQGQSEQAYNLFSAAAQKDAPKDNFVTFNSGVLNTDYDLTKCALVGTPQLSGQTAVVAYHCPTRDGKQDTTFTFNLVTEQSYKINSYDLKTKAA